MEFIKELRKTNPSPNPGDYRNLNRIPAGIYYLSIQGSFSHYCSPRKSIRIDKYETMEIALFTKEGNWVNYTQLKAFPKYKELLKYADGLGEITVYGYVPVTLIEELYLFLKKLPKP